MGGDICSELKSWSLAGDNMESKVSKKTDKTIYGKNILQNSDYYKLCFEREK